MKTRLRLLQLFFASALLAALAVQSWHGWADYTEKQRERHCEHKPYSKESITHTHASLEHCWVCDFTFAPYAPFTIALAETVPSGPFFHPSFTAYRNASHTWQQGVIRKRGPPTVNV